MLCKQAWTLTMRIYYGVTVLSLINLAASAPGLYFSGDGDSTEHSEDLETCDRCLEGIRNRLILPNTKQRPHCNEVARLTECFERCTPNLSHLQDPNNIKVLQMVGYLTKIFSILKSEHCEISEENAPGCDPNILECVQPLTLIDTYTDSLREVYCSDEAMISVLKCTQRLSDCEWRTNIEMIASLSRRSLCFSKDKCMAGGVMFVLSPGSRCTRFKMAALNNLKSLDSQREQQTAPGTKFDISICRLQHSALVKC